MYNVSEHGNSETYLIQGADSNPLLTSQLLEQIEAMYNGGAPEFIADQGLYYPTTTNYGYYCTGFESPGEWEDHHRIFGLDGPDIQYAGAQTESFPYVYYTPSYGHAQSPYNPFNPYIPGATIGVDSPFVEAQQYYPVLPYQNAVTSSPYIPFVFEQDIIPNSSSDPLLDACASTANRPEGRALKHKLSSASAAFHRNPPKFGSDQTIHLSRVSERPRTNVGPSKQPAANGSISSSTFSNAASSQGLLGINSSGTIQALDNLSNGNVLAHRSHLKVALPFSNGFSDFGSSAHGRAALDKFRPKIHISRGMNDMNGSPDALGEQNRGPRTSRLKNQLAVKAYTTKGGDSNGQGNITIYTDQYNKDDFAIDYRDGKFYVIKSYSEDDVHKSIKYNVWSSTPHGNKKLESAYADAQRIATGKPGGCPIFMFFSVNASGQFCGVAEMIGPVDFHKDMDFWQQDKWSGSFPVKWHVIKDVPNTSFRHIILENNENKPVTNSRDTQEIMYKQGAEMLKTFKNYTARTSLLDDFMYYENRQKIMQEEKARILFKNFESPIFVPALYPPRKLNCIGGAELLPNEDGKITKDQNKSKKIVASPTEKGTRNENTEQIAVEAKDDITSSTLNIGSLTINQKQDELKPLAAATSDITSTKPSVSVLTVGSMPVKVNGFAESSGFLTVGTIPLDHTALQLDKGGGVANNGSQHY